MCPQASLGGWDQAGSSDGCGRALPGGCPPFCTQSPSHTAPGTRGSCPPHPASVWTQAGTLGGTRSTSVPRGGRSSPLCPVPAGDYGTGAAFVPPTPASQQGRRPVTCADAPCPASWSPSSSSPQCPRPHPQATGCPVTAHGPSSRRPSLACGLLCLPSPG